MQSSKKMRIHGKARPCRGWAGLLVLVVVATSALTAQTRQRGFTDRLLIEAAAQVLVPARQPAGIGGGLALGYEFRDFNLLLRASGLVADIGNNSRSFVSPGLRAEMRLPVLPSFLTLLPFVDMGVFAGRFRGASGEGSETGTVYFAGGLGAELLLSHELSAIGRVGFLRAQLAVNNELNDFSGPTVEMAMRYTLGRSRGLDY